MIIWCKQTDGSDHDKHLLKFLQITRWHNLKCNLEKLLFKSTQASFFGTTFTSEGQKPENEKVQAISKMPQVTNMKDLQWMFGMVNYWTSCVHDLQNLVIAKSSPRKNVPLKWGPQHSWAFNAIKKEITSLHILKYYDSMKPFTLQTDTSLKGLSAVLLQEGHPVYFASRSLHPH